MNFSHLKGKNILVTGGAGFIGSHVVDSLVNIGANVTVLDNFSTGKKENLSHSIKDINLIEGDIRNLEVCKKVMKKIELVSHQAALGSVPRSLENPSASIEVNVIGSTNIFTAARDCEVERIVFASSSSVYGDSQKLPKKEGEEGKPVSPYAFSKITVENLANVFAKCFNMKFIGLRYFNVYGTRQNPEGDYAAVIPRFFKAYLNNMPPVIFGSGNQTRDFTYVQDVVKANLLALLAESNLCNSCYNISGGNPVSINYLAETISELCGKRSIKPIYKEERVGDILHSEGDLTKSKMIGYFPSVKIENGLKITYEKYYQFLW